MHTDTLAPATSPRRSRHRYDTEQAAAQGLPRTHLRAREERVLSELPRRAVTVTPLRVDEDSAGLAPWITVAGSTP